MVGEDIKRQERRLFLSTILPGAHHLFLNMMSEARQERANGSDLSHLWDMKKPGR